MRREDQEILEEPIEKEGDNYVWKGRGEKIAGKSLETRVGGTERCRIFCVTGNDPSDFSHKPRTSSHKPRTERKSGA